MYWLPEELLEDRVKEDKIPYDIWRDMGLLRTVPGNKIHYKHVTDWFLEVQNQDDIYIPWGGYDSWSAEYWAVSYTHLDVYKRQIAEKLTMMK